MDSSSNHDFNQNHEKQHLITCLITTKVPDVPDVPKIVPSFKRPYTHLQFGLMDSRLNPSYDTVDKLGY